MAYCDYCNNKMDEIPFHCRRCGSNYCSNHRLPEDHNCPGLKRGNLFESLGPKKGHKTHNHDTSRQEPSFIENPKSFFKRKYYKIKYWLKSREYRRYTNWNAFFMNILWIVILSILFMIIYSNLPKLNEIVLWFLPLGGTLFLVNAFFLIKYIWKLLKRMCYWYKGERNWIKYLLLLLLIILLWQGYVNRETLFDNAIEKYNQVDFSAILPLGISEDIPDESLFSKKSINTISDGITQNVEEVINPEPISDKTMDVEKAILKYTNVERKSNGIVALQWDDKLATVARDHSLDMVQNNFFSHDNLNGEDPTDRAIRHGYNVHKELGGGWYSDGIAENIGKMPTGNVEGMGYVSNDADSVGKAQVESWMDSPGHRANILNSEYGILGAGCAYDGLYYVCTQDFK
jgi:uncharacterized protein YkwD